MHWLAVVPALRAQSSMVSRSLLGGVFAMGYTSSRVSVAAMTRDDDSRFRAAHSALQTVAVTGTNGKTTTTSMIHEVVVASGECSAYVTTLGAWVGAEPIAARDGEEFLATVERAVAAGARTLCLEVTSKALALGLAQRWPAQIAVFTNLSRDHLDMHQSPEAYLAAKAQLFLALPAHGVAVLNADDPCSALIAELLPAAVRVRWFSLFDRNVDLSARSVEVCAKGTQVALAPSSLSTRLGQELSLRAVGRVHAQNALACALACDAAGYSPDAIRRGLSQFAGVTGRFQIIATRPLVVVDYAHTPDGLDGTLRTARELVGKAGRLVCVFGCGGDRDRGKRPSMGAVVHRLADVAVLTNDNPRRESPVEIAAQVREGVSGQGAEWQQRLDRGDAIESTIAAATCDDVVVIAGKGHEAAQEIGDLHIPFSDVAAATSAVRKRLNYALS